MKNYEQKYKEALEQMKRYVKDEYGCTRVRPEEIFPELKESEDERIRKRIIHALHGDVLDMEETNKALAWLEKQKPQSIPTEGVFPYTDTADTLNGEIDNIWNKLSCDGKFSATKEGFQEVIYHFIKYALKDKGLEDNDGQKRVEENKGNDGGISLNTEITLGAKDSELQEETYYIPQGFQAEVNDNKVVIKKGEQKTAEWSEEDERIYTSIMDDTVQENQLGDEQTNWLKSLRNRCLSQSKQEWGEEDSKRLQRIIDFLWYNRKGDTDTIYQQEQDIAWLKSLRPQPKQKWNTEDEKIRNELMHFFESMFDCLASEERHQQYRRWFNWLKSLHSNHWKPTEEQMKALKQASDEHWEPDGLDPLYTLYNELKEL